MLGEELVIYNQLLAMADQSAAETLSLQASLDALQANHALEVAGLNTRIDDLETSLLADNSAKDENSADGNALLLAQMIGDHQQSEWDMTINACATSNSNAGIAGSLGIGTQISLEGMLGADIFGNGAEAKLSGAGTLGFVGDICAGSDVVISACMRGADIRVGDLSDDEQSVVDEYNDAAEELRERLLSTMDALGMSAGQLDNSLGVMTSIGLPTNPADAWSGDGASTASAGTAGSAAIADALPGESGWDDLIPSLPLSDSLRNSFYNRLDMVPGSIADLTVDCDDPATEAIAEICDLADGAVTTLDDAVGILNDTVNEAHNAVIGTVYDAQNNVIGTVYDAQNAVTGTVISARNSVNGTVISARNSLRAAMNSFCEMSDDLGFLLDWALGRDINCPIN